MARSDQPPPDDRSRARVLADLTAEGRTTDDPVGWFERLYRAAAAGSVGVPWDRGGAHPMIVEWARQRDLDGTSRTALVVGAGLGYDAEFIAGLGFAVTAFDVSATAVELARAKFPGTDVAYTVADLFDPPPQWHRRFDLVLESYTVQSLPRHLRAAAVQRVADFVAPFGTLLVLAMALGADGNLDAGPPWPLTRDELNAFIVDDLRPSVVELTPHPDQHEVLMWRAELTRLAVLPPPPQH